MARIAGVNLPVQKHVWVGLQSIYGIGRTRSKLVCVSAGVVPATSKISGTSTVSSSSRSCCEGLRGSRLAAWGGVSSEEPVPFMARSTRSMPSVRLPAPQDPR